MDDPSKVSRHAGSRSAAAAPRAGASIRTRGRPCRPQPGTPMARLTRRSPIRGGMYATRTLLATLALLTASACVDGPAAPDGAGLTFGAYVLQPSLTLVAPRSTVVTAAVADALSDAFDRVDTFRMTVRRAANGALVVETSLSVTPGQDAYDLSIEATGVTAGESLLVTVVALQGSTVLFQSQPIPVTAQASSSSQAPQPVNVPLTYSGPGSEATEISVGPEAVLLGPGGSGSFGVSVRNADGSEVPGVPVSWTTESSGVAGVDAQGTVSGVSTGRTRVTATIPTGLSASGWVYVLAGEVAYVKGGSVVTREVGGGSETDRGAGTMPAWSPDGDQLLVERGGMVTDAGSGAGLFEGSSPSVSPDRAKIAAERGGTVYFANPDGTQPTAGPAGTTPVWDSGSTLVVGGGSVERVRADGTGRTTIAPGSARWPAVSGGGATAWVAGDALVVDGGSPVMTGVDSRPTWSPDGAWLVASANGDLHVVPADGSGPAVAMGTAGGSFPAWKPSGGASPSPAALQLTGLNPDPPTPGAPVDLVGGGFDWIIPANNRAFFPGPSGEVEAEVLSVSETALRVMMPTAVAEGRIRVTNFTDQTTLAFVPALGSVSITARTPWGVPVENVRIRLTQASQQVADVRTDADGKAVIADLADGTYSVVANGPTGFQVVAPPATVAVAVGTATALDLVVQPLVQILTLEPAVPSMSVGGSVQVTARAIDINGQEIQQFTSATWFALSRAVAVSGDGLTGTLTGVYPTGSEGGGGFRLILNGQVFDLGATVRSKITGVVRKRTPQEGAAQAASQAASDLPEPGATVELVKGESVVSSAVSGPDGRYAFEGLLAGSYTVRVANLMESYTSTAVSLELGAGLPVGTADLLIRPRPPAGAGDLVAINDWNAWDTNQNPGALVQTLIGTANNSGTRVVWWCGRQSSPSGSALSGGICASSINADGSGQFQGTRNAITGGGWGFEVDYQTPLTTIADDVRVFWMWTPTDQLTDAEVNVLKAFAGRGGRIIFNADYKPSWYSDAQHTNIATRLFSQLGTGITSVGTYITTASTGVPADPSHPLAVALAAQDITQMRFGAPGNFTVTAPGVGIIVGSGEILVAYAPVDPTPLPLTTARAAVAPTWTPTVPTVLDPSCRPGLACAADTIKR